MASLVNKIKEKVHRRSESSSSATAGDTNGSSELRTNTTSTPDSPSSFDRDGYRAKPRVSLENSAFHVTSTGGVRQSHEAPRDPYQASYANSNGSNQNRRIVSLGNHEPTSGQGFGERELGGHGVSTNGSSHRRNISLEEQQANINNIVPGRGSSKNAVVDSPNRFEQSPAQARNFAASTPDRQRSMEPGLQRHHDRSIGEPASIRRVVDEHESSGDNSFRSVGSGSSHPARKDSLPSNAFSNTQTTHNPQSMGNPKMTSDSLAARSSPRQPMTKQGSGHLALDAQVAEQYLSSPRDTVAEKEKASALNSGHLKLPSAFDLRDTETTHVTEDQRPAVTHETIIRQRTEIIQESITRDIHIHHYYTYLQPVRVVEILPARHYFLDLKTGIKTEVLPPADYQLPLNMTPISPDANIVKATTRHYLVDEEHPHGVFESPPLKHEERREGLRNQMV